MNIHDRVQDQPAAVPHVGEFPANTSSGTESKNGTPVPTRPLEGIRIAVFVDNRALHDTRVIKQAETLAANGATVRVYCRWTKDLPELSTRNGVEYARTATPVLRRFTEGASITTDLLGVYFGMPGGLWFKLRGTATFATIYGAAALRRAMRRGFAVYRTSRRGRSGWRKAGARVAFASLAVAFAPILAVRAFDRVIETGRWSSLWAVPKPITTALAQPTKKAKNTYFWHRILSAITLYDSDSFYVFRTMLRAGRLFRYQLPSVREFAPDIIHMHDLVNLPTGAKFKKALNVPVIYDAHELEAERDKPKQRKWKNRVLQLENRMIRKIDGAITVSYGIADYMAEKHGIVRPTVVYNAPSLEKAMFEERCLRSGLGLPETVPLAVYVGKLRMNRGFPIFIRAVAKNPGFHLAIVGPALPDAIAQVDALVDELGVADRVHIVPPVPPYEVISYVRSANISLIPAQSTDLSYVYAMPNKFFESLAAGVPILVGKEIIEMANTVTEHRLGLTMQQDDPDDIARAMLELYERRHEFQATPELIRQRNEQFGWIAQERRLIQLYQDILEAKRSGTRRSIIAKPGGSA